MAGHDWIAGDFSAENNEATRKRFAIEAKIFSAHLLAWINNLFNFGNLFSSFSYYFGQARIVY